MNSVAILLFVLVVQLSNGDLWTHTATVEDCPSFAEVTVAAERVAGGTHWSAFCGPLPVLPLAGKGA